MPESSNAENIPDLPFEPVDEMILLQRLEPEDEVNGLTMPKVHHDPNAKMDPSNFARVIKVGQGRPVLTDKTVLALPPEAHPTNLLATIFNLAQRHHGSRYSPGQVVIIGKWEGTTIQHQGQDYLLINEDRVLGLCTK